MIGIDRRKIRRGRRRRNDLGEERRKWSQLKHAIETFVLLLTFWHLAF